MKRQLNTGSPTILAPLRFLHKLELMLTTPLVPQLQPQHLNNLNTGQKMEANLVLDTPDTALVHNMATSNEAGLT